MTRARDLADFNLDGKAVTINESSADLDFRVESDNATNALFVQGSDGKVGVKPTAAPNLQMSVNFDTSAVAGFGLHDTTLAIWAACCSSILALVRERFVLIL